MWEESKPNMGGLPTRRRRRSLSATEPFRPALVSSFCERFASCFGTLWFSKEGNDHHSPASFHARHTLAAPLDDFETSPILWPHLGRSSARHGGQHELLAEDRPSRGSS